MEDRLLILRCKRGSKDALSRIYEKYKRDLFVLAMTLLNDASAAEDVVHDVFLSFVQRLESYRPSGSLRRYLLTSVANRARNMLKSHHRQGIELGPSDAVCCGSKDPPQAIICNEQLEVLNLAMAQLPFEQREVIMLRFQARMTFKTIARSVGISVNTVKSRYRYGFEKLRSFFDDGVGP